MPSTKKRIAAALTATILTTTFVAPAMAMETQAIRVSSYKGNTLEVGEGSGLIIGPSGADYTVTSSNPDTVVIEQVLTFWVAVAKMEGSAEITASNSAGEYGTVTLTVGAAVDPAQRAVDNWINSSGHCETMIDPRCDCIGVGVTQHDGITYCYMFVGIPNSVNFYA